jgi:hypothetical protein
MENISYSPFDNKVTVYQESERGEGMNAKVFTI